MQLVADVALALEAAQSVDADVVTAVVSGFTLVILCSTKERTF